MKNEGLEFICFGGCSEIGMNLYAYIYEDQWILVDMGMGFSNKLGQELIVPSPEMLIKNKLKIKALVITHSHEDHIGAIPYLWPMIECPIYGRPFALEMIKDKLIQFSLDKKVPMIRVTTNKEIKIGKFIIEYIPVAHSTPESSAILIKTPYETVVHTGDWRLDNNPVLCTKTDEETLQKIGDNGVDALVCDSTNVFQEEQTSSEDAVRTGLIDLIKQHKKSRVLVTCFASNVARLETCYLAAKATNRELVTVGRSLKKIEKVARAAGYLADVPAFLDDRKAASLSPSKVLLVCTGSQGEQNSALNKIANECHKTIHLEKGDVLIFSSRVIPGNERSVLNIQNALARKGVKIITSSEYNIHASGHPSKADLYRLYDLVKPKALIPIHGENIHLYRHEEIATEYGIKNVIVPSDGSKIRITPDGAKLVATLDVDMLAVDGHNLLPVSGTVYKEREKLSTNGVFSIVLKNTKGVLKMLDFNHFGVFEKSEEDAVQQIKQELEEELRGIVIKGKLSTDELKIVVAESIRSILIDNRGKKPVLFVHIVN